MSDIFLRPLRERHQCNFEILRSTVSTHLSNNDIHNNLMNHPLPHSGKVTVTI